jgi:hypothetical protein
MRSFYFRVRVQMLDTNQVFGVDRTSLGTGRKNYGGFDRLRAAEA